VLRAPDVSLRARLISGLLVLAAVGLLLLGGITYFEQRAFLLERVDQQLTSAVPAVAHALDDTGGGIPGMGFAPRFGPGRRGGPGRAEVSLPPGTYGERRDAEGDVIGSPVVLSYGRQDPPVPDLPPEIEPGRLITVGAVGESDLRYRAVAALSADRRQITVAAVPLRELDATLDRLLLVEALVITAVLIALGALSWVLVRLGLRPLDRIADTAGAIAAGDLSRRVSPATPRTEVGRLGLSLNAMLERLEQAFAEREASQDRLRQFIADASHELRTPLASIRGYAELFRIGAASRPEDNAKAMRRIEEEAVRMGVLVEDLLTLARLDEVREAAHEDVDLAALAGDAVQDARATAPDRPIQLDAEAPAIVSGDAHQLRQVLANLMRNALVHTPPGSRIDVSVDRPEPDRVRLEIRDHGPGLPTDDPSALFERFWRAEQGRERGRAGAGLGLAIVSGVVAFHHGTVRARNAAGGGASFTVELPARPDRT
jgi:two-component system OmpR family sensor kinase